MTLTMGEQFGNHGGDKFLYLNAGFPLNLSAQVEREGVVLLLGTIPTMAQHLFVFVVAEKPKFDHSI